MSWQDLLSYARTSLDNEIPASGAIQSYAPLNRSVDMRLDQLLGSRRRRWARGDSAGRDASMIATRHGEHALRRNAIRRDYNEFVQAVKERESEAT